uniref:Uncharacterized protein n=1 Tax=Anguilla anguilla TaxID=7936 RepID=A0A0E9QVV6_ANGAN
MSCWLVNPPSWAMISRRHTSTSLRSMLTTPKMSLREFRPWPLIS